MMIDDLSMERELCETKDIIRLNRSIHITQKTPNKCHLFIMMVSNGQGWRPII